VSDAPEALRARRLRSPVGTLTLVASASGLRAILWPGDARPVRVGDTTAAADVDLERPVADVADVGHDVERSIDGITGDRADGGGASADALPAVEADIRAILDAASAQIGEYFAGLRHRFTLPLEPFGTPFQVAVWMSLDDIAYGDTATYGEQAARLGRPTAVRAVGSANGRNPLSIVLPCHRVVGRDGRLTGFAGGLDAKAFLLDHEARHRT